MQRIADALDPPSSYSSPPPSGRPWPRPVWGLIGGVIAAIIIAVPADLIRELTSSRTLGNTIFFGGIALGVMIGALLR